MIFVVDEEIAVVVSEAFAAASLEDTAVCRELVGFALDGFKMPLGSARSESAADGAEAGRLWHASAAKLCVGSVHVELAVLSFLNLLKQSGMAEGGADNEVEETLEASRGVVGGLKAIDLVVCVANVKTHGGY